MREISSDGLDVYSWKREVTYRFHRTGSIHSPGNSAGRRDK